MIASADPATLAATFVVLYAAHSVGDHWVQTCHQAGAKGGDGTHARWACAGHVASLTVVKALVLLALVLLTTVTLSPVALVVGLSVDAVSHYWADRRTTLAALAARLRLTPFYQLGTPRPGHDDAPHLGTGAYALDQAWHVGWLLVTAFIIAVGSAL